MRRALILAAGILWGCNSDNEAPILDPVGDQRAFVNTELTLTLTAWDPDGEPVTFSFAGDIEGIESRASLTDATNARAVFRWTPLASDVGVHAFDFEVSDGEASARATISIDVGIGDGGTAPIFIKPLGTGTTLDVRTQECLEVPILIEDQDTPGVQLGQEEPVIEGATVTQESELSGTWGFCPTQAQIDAADRYTLTLSADDGDNEKTLKPYLIVLRSESKPDCPGEAPVVAHQAADANTLDDITISADVSDELGIKYEPLVYYSLDDPGPDPDVTLMTQLTMSLASGDMQNGTWTAVVPNPVASQQQGATAELYYVIVAQDNDDAEGNCDHLTEEAYSMTVVNPGGSGGNGLCESCTSDAQCGGPGDNCVYMDDGYYCFKGCQSSSECPQGYYCSFSNFTSIDNASARQCIPDDYTCTDTPPPSCVDDSFEENDTLSVASTKSALPTGSHFLKSCPAGTGDDEDWFKISITADAQSSFTLSGGTSTDLDLAIYDQNGALIEKSESLTSNESLSQCLSPGTYYVRVYAWGSGENSYTLGFTKTTASCASICADDGAEDDDNTTQARLVDLNLGTYHSNSNAICSWDDDWYEVYMYSGETLYATLTFTQLNSSQDLDIYIYQGSTNLTGCTESNPWACDPNNGQSGTSNETFAWPISQTGTYYLVVHGWAGSENSYNMCAGLTSASCP
ncbi:MAG TPA: pre-peptidase C-terminal domain-containing protein [Polyangiaceae bacterium]|nr:pre-peptidase C-terminal domain-containing protein [Polyangiaceae bacterium]